MKTQSRLGKQGSVLLVAILTLTILSLICALSLYVTSQNTNATSQTASWQAALSGAESGVENAYYALNKQTWTGWKTVAGSPPKTQPTGGSATTAAPASGEYAYVGRTLQVAGEGGGTIKFWVTVDTAGLPKDNNGNQWYRIRATGLAAAPGPPRVSNQKRDNDLRKISLRTDRLSGLALATPQAARTIEVIAQPIAKSIWSRAVTLEQALTMSGSGLIDSFDSSNGLYSTNHLYDPSRRQTHGDVGMNDSTGSNLKSNDVYGNVAYSGPAIKNTKNVHGTISSPFSVTIPATSNPTWSAGTYTSYATAPAVVTSGTSANPALIKVNGNFSLGANNTFTINPADASKTDNAVIIWVTGSFAIGGNAKVIQNSNVKVTWYVDSNINIGGNGYQNLDGYAANANFIGVGSHTLSISGNGNFIATVNAPGYSGTLSGNGSFIGAVIALNLAFSGNPSIHYDQALGGGSGNVNNFSYASWFEDNADVPRGATF